MEIIDRFVDYNKYCKICKHRNLEEFRDPCNDCLDNPVMAGTKIPMHYEEDEKRKKEVEKEDK